MDLLQALLADPELVPLSFGGASVRGQGYFGRGAVGKLEITDDKARARVRGSLDRLYDTELRLASPAGRAVLASRCSCPIAVNCKHGAALAWAVLAHAQAGGKSAATAAPAPAAAPSQPSAAPDPWQSWRRELESASRPSAPPTTHTIYVLGHERDHSLWLKAFRGRQLKSGQLGALKPVELNAYRPLEWLDSAPAADRLLLLTLRQVRTSYDPADRAPRYHLDDLAEARLPALLEQGQVWWERHGGAALALGEPRQQALDWRFDAQGGQRLVPVVADLPGVLAVGSSWNWYVDPAARRFGPLQGTLTVPQVRALRRLPAVQPGEIEAAAAALQLPALALPKPRTLQLRRSAPQPPRVLLRLDRLGFEMNPQRHLEAVLLEAMLDYPGQRLRLGDPQAELRRFEDGVLNVSPRNVEAEQQLVHFLERQDFQPLVDDHGRSGSKWRRPKRLNGSAAIRDWTAGFVAAAQSAGYRVEGSPQYPVPIGQVVEAIDLELGEPDAGGDWFEARLGIELDGQRVDLAPLLIAAISDPGAWSADYLKLQLADGRRLLLPRARLQPLLELLAEFEKRGEGLAVPRHRLHALQPAPDQRLLAGPAAEALRQQLQQFGGLQPAVVPDSFKGELRAYQQRGVAWLQFLRELRFGGVLADDMGLGKTVQLLAHLCLEQVAGRLDLPALVVCPTSVIGNWDAEAARFAPGLRRLVFHGSDRAALAPELAASDLVITSYALLQRDAALLAKQPFSWAIFDEAQWLKNAASKSYAAAAGLQARQRLCMTGTPVENNLGELKAQFDLAFPGLLGSSTRFARDFRTPIEKQGDGAAAARLQRRIGPFLLRRRKSEVATELPPRSTIVQHVELAGAQRDLYESIRVQMERRVREALAEHGLERIRITLLDALLKLRQVCCDPRLLDSDTARKVQQSAKLEALLELLPTLVEDGRAVLLFSQFTSMLDLIQAELQQRKIAFVRLDGSTRDRAAPVWRFQAGAVPVFLISLKAGGVGLNLTRADTVILYDPWWNPAVEAQAIDRAHRIGQDKPVFVYELTVVGTVEEKMQALKARKRSLADSVLAEGEAALAKLDGAELLALFEA